MIQLEWRKLLPGSGGGLQQPNKAHTLGVLQNTAVDLVQAPSLPEVAKQLAPIVSTLFSH